MQVSETGTSSETRFYPDWNIDFTGKGIFHFQRYNWGIKKKNHHFIKTAQGFLSSVKNTVNIISLYFHHQDVQMGQKLYNCH